MVPQIARMNRRTIHIPGDKSISHRAVLCSGIATGTSRLRNLASGQDVGSSMACMQALGVVTEPANDGILIHGRGLRGLVAPSGALDCGNSGTTIRLLSGIMAGQSFRSLLTGDSSLRRRPMTRVMQPLALMGATFPESDDGRAPFSVQGAYPLRAIEFDLPVPSAQVKSAVLLAGLYADGETTVREVWRTRDHTERLLGARVSVRGLVQSSTITPPERIDPIDIVVPGDPSSAAFLTIALLLLGRDDVVVPRVLVNPTRVAYLDVLRSSGAQIELLDEAETGGEPIADIHVHRSQLRESMTIGDDVSGLIDEIPALAVVAACSGIACTVRNAEELRHKESDRIALLVRNLRAIGCEVEEYPDGFASIRKNGLIGASIETHGDHRIAMAFGVAALVVPGIFIDDPACVDVSFPGFWDILQGLRA